jgi:hypothetical protein
MGQLVLRLPYTVLVLILSEWVYYYFKSRADELFLFTCDYHTDEKVDSLQYQRHKFKCGLIFGCIESSLFLGFLCLLFKYISNLHWKYRYQSHISPSITSILEQDKANKHKYKNNNNNNSYSNSSRNPNQNPNATELISSLFSYNFFDPFMIAFPWLITPFMKWHTMTNFVIHCSQHLAYYIHYIRRTAAAEAQQNLDFMMNMTMNGTNGTGVGTGINVSNVTNATEFGFGFGTGSNISNSYSSYGSYSSSYSSYYEA